MDPADRMRRDGPSVAVRTVAALVLGSTRLGARQPDRPRAREERSQALGHRDRPRAGPPAAVGGGERLVEVQVDDVEPHVTWAHDTEDGVQVRFVVVEETTDI